MKNSKEKTKTVRIPEYMDVHIQQYVDAGTYQNSSEVIREAVRQWIDKKKSQTFIAEVARQAESSGIIEISSTKADLAERRAKRKKKVL